MKVIFCLTGVAVLSVVLCFAGNVLATEQATTPGSWYFAVSGDSRDCGGLVMAKIANAVASDTAAPAQFYWHLGDLRNMVTPDCDMLIPQTKDPNCLDPQLAFTQAWGRFSLDYYLTQAWDDFISHQIGPFGDLPFYIGIGNHELLGRTRKDFRGKFQKWLTQDVLWQQQIMDARRRPQVRAAGYGLTYYHFIKRGVDFIYLDNAEDETGAATQFDLPQLRWLRSVIQADLADNNVKTLIVGMHAALPGSSSKNHAMDATCWGTCTGQWVYDLLNQAAQKKPVYALASHAHNYQPDLYNTTDHRGQVLPGWLVGTAGAMQYFRQTPPDNLLPSAARDQVAINWPDCWQKKICYGYLQVEVKTDGTINPQFKEVTAQTPPIGDPLVSDYCFNKNGGPSAGAPPPTCDCSQYKLPDKSLNAPRQPAPKQRS